MWVSVLKFGVFSDSDMDSLLQTKLLRYSSRRILLSSEDEDNGRGDEVTIRCDSAAEKICRTSSNPSNGQSPQTQQYVTPSQADDSPAKDEDSITPPASAETMEVDPHELGSEVVIDMTQAGNRDSVWDSDADMWDSLSESETPGYKRGQLPSSTAEWEPVHTKDPNLGEERSQFDDEIVKLIQQDCKLHVNKLRKPPSVHILADAKLENWSKIDNICVLDYKPGWNFKKWISALRAETIRINCNTVILYLERSQEFDQVPPLKNGLHTMCKIIRQHQKGVRIFISNLLPRIHGSPVGCPLMDVNYILLQAVRSVTRAIGKTHYLSVYEHFVSCKSHKIIKLTHQFFRENGQMTKFGCLILCECFLREAGLKTYWF